MRKRKKEEAVKVFVGTSAGGEDAEACVVFEHTLRAHSSLPVEIEWVRLSRDPDSPMSGWMTERWSTPWTALRWAVPGLCAWQGRAVYFDCATIVLGDVAELVTAPMANETSVLVHRSNNRVDAGCLVFDCARLRRYLPSLDELRSDIGAHQTVGGILMGPRSPAGPLPPGWGMTDAAYSANQAAVTGSVRFTSPRTQPHVTHAVRRLYAQGRRHWFRAVRLPHYCAALVALYEQELAAAIADGVTPDQYEFEGAEYGEYDIPVLQERLSA